MLNLFCFGFNGKEKDDEITGVSGSNTTAMFWEYDSRLGRRWNLDPKPTFGLSDYSCFSNNPIMYSDVFGDTIRCANAESMLLFEDDMINSVFTSEDAMNQFFVKTNGGLSYKPINKYEFNKHIRKQNWSADKKAYARGLFKAINNERILNITYVEGTVSDVNFDLKNIKQVNVSIAKANGGKSQVIDGKGNVCYEWDRRVTAAHEILGEGLVRLELKLDKNNENNFKSMINVMSYLYVQPVKVSNLMARILNLGWQRTGDDHAVKSQRNISLLKSDPIPDDMKSVESINIPDREKVKKEATQKNLE